MRTIRIDFTNQSVSYPDGALAGRRGEHLMTQLIISLPEELGASEIEYYRIAFCRSVSGSLAYFGTVFVRHDTGRKNRADVSGLLSLFKTDK